MAPSIVAMDVRKTGMVPNCSELLSSLFAIVSDQSKDLSVPKEILLDDRFVQMQKLLPLVLMLSLNGVVRFTWVFSGCT
jgi:hypothetical protein